MHSNVSLYAVLLMCYIGLGASAMADTAKRNAFALLNISADSDLENTGFLTDSNYETRVFGVKGSLYLNPRYQLNLFFLNGTTDIEYSVINQALETDFVSGTLQLIIKKNALILEQWISYADSDYTSKRFSYDPVTDTNSLTNVGLYDGRQLTLAGSIAREYIANEISIKPSIGYLHSSYHQDAYTESGSGGQRFNNRAAVSNRFHIAFSAHKVFYAEAGHQFKFSSAFRLSYETNDFAPNGSLDRLLPLAGGAFLIDSSTAAADKIPNQTSRHITAGLAYTYKNNARISLGFIQLRNSNLDVDAWTIAASLFL